MRYRINQIRLGIEHNDGDFVRAIRKQLRRKDIDPYDVEIVKESVDARRKPDIKLVYTLDFSCDVRLDLPKPGKMDYDSLKKRTGRIPGGSRPVVAGFGPCGMFAALVLAEHGFRPVVIERGQTVDERVSAVKRFWNEGILDTESNVQFGEGGAGTFSDGKLTTGIKDIRISKVLKEFVRAGADPDILYKQKPHIGTDRLREIVKAIRKRVEALGGTIYFDTKLDSIITEEKKDGKYLTAVILKDRKGGKTLLETENLVLAIGHSARDTFEMLLKKGIVIEQKPFSIGVRIQHLQSRIDRAQYGNCEAVKKLGAAEYKLSHKCSDGRGVYTFCMCPGGEVINASSERDTAVTNGMSNSGRDGKYANSGLLVDVRTEDFKSDHPLAGVEFQRKYEKLAYENGNGMLPETDYGSFRRDSSDPVRKSIPGFASDAILEAMPFLAKKLKGFDDDDAIMKAVESRSSSPVRIVRNDSHQANISGVYPSGEGAGYAGGIMSAAVDGIKTAEKIMDVIFL